ncbi:MAG: hypothetical protein WBC04_04165 [Candidatus Acidiferrales bacterium]
MKSKRKGLPPRAVIFLALAYFACLGGPPPKAQEPAQHPEGQAETPLPRGKKLFLKDGTFHLVQTYRVESDRVRYYSLDRSQWEEIPTALVDWDATKKAEAAETQKDAAIVANAHKDEQARRAETPLDVDASLELIPGVFLPPGEGAFVLDGKAVFPLPQAPTVEKLDKRQLVKQILVPVPLIPTRRNISLKGNRAALRVSNPQPEFYMRTTEPVEPHLELVRAKVHGDVRLIENVNQLFAVEWEKRDSVPLQLWQVAKGVYRFTLGESLPSGEYVLVEVIQDQPKQKEINLYVWDFGLDTPSAATGVKPK